jgi:hypothetical protein
VTITDTISISSAVDALEVVTGSAFVDDAVGGEGSGSVIVAGCCTGESEPCAGFSVMWVLCFNGRPSVGAVFNVSAVALAQRKKTRTFSLKGFTHAPVEIYPPSNHGNKHDSAYKRDRF